MSLLSFYQSKSSILSATFSVLLSLSLFSAASFAFDPCQEKLKQYPGASFDATLYPECQVLHRNLTAAARNYYGAECEVIRTTAALEQKETLRRSRQNLLNNDRLQNYTLLTPDERAEFEALVADYTEFEIPIAQESKESAQEWFEITAPAYSEAIDAYSDCDREQHENDNQNRGDAGEDDPDGHTDPIEDEGPRNCLEWDEVLEEIEPGSYELIRYCIAWN